MRKENLILIHSFPTNSILLAGLIDFFSDYFRVYPIDLPGFISGVPPLRKVALEGYTRYLDGEIRKLGLNHYLIGGISFGFWVICGAKLTRACRGVLAIEPYTDKRCLRTRQIVVWKTLVRLHLGKLLNLYSLIWRTGWWRRYYREMTGYAIQRVNVILREVDGRTYFETARLLLMNRRRLKLHDLPHVLIINTKDVTLNAGYIIDQFKERCWQLLIIRTKVGHYPRDMSKRYFMKKIKEEDVARIYRFFDGVSD